MVTSTYLPTAREGNVFRSMCQSFRSRGAGGRGLLSGGRPPQKETPPGQRPSRTETPWTETPQEIVTPERVLQTETPLDRDPQPRGPPQRPVRILLECILVMN